MTGYVLSDFEARALARRLLVDRVLGSWDRLVSWEDVPGLSEGSWTAVAEALDELATEAHKAALAADRDDDTDGLYLYEMASVEAAHGRTDGDDAAAR